MPYALRSPFFCLFISLGTLWSLDTTLADEAEKQTSPVAKADESDPPAEDDKSQSEEVRDDAEDGKRAAKAKQKKPQLRQISLAGNYVDLVQPLAFNPLSMAMGSTPAKQRSFFKLCKFIDDLAEDERFSYVAFDLSASQLSMNSAQLDELSRHIKKLKDAGKRTYAWLENASNVHLAVAACCDEVFIADFGGIDMPSAAMQSMFFSDAMDLIGIKASVVRAGDFKGAVEPYLNAHMSDHLRDHYRNMIVSINNATIDRIARGRGLKHSDVRKLQAKRIHLPQEALATGLVDQLAPYGSMQATIESAVGEPIEWVTAKAAAKKQMSFFQLMGQMMAGPQGSSGRIRKNTIAVLHFSGPIMDGKKQVPGSVISKPMIELIEKLTDEEKVVAAVVRINSPGGSATASEAIRQALVKLAKAKPTVVSMGDMAASGGYWISCIDAPIYAEKATITGSIGVFSLKFSAGALLRRVGVHLESITLDDSAGVFSLDRPWSDRDNAMLQGTVDMAYRRFLNLVHVSRGIELETLEQIAGGRVWSGEQAKQHALVDQLGGLDDCLAAVAKKAKLEDYHVVHRPIPRIGIDLSELFGSGGEEEIWSGVPGIVTRVLQQRGLSLEVTKMLLNEHVTKAGKPTMWLLDPLQFSIR